MADESIRLIPLGRSGKHAIVDAQDFEALTSLACWHVNSQGYARRSFTRAMRCGEVKLPFLMHRIVMGALGEQEVDHVNGNRLDNPRCNLRFATYAQNRMNIPKFHGKFASRFKGVTWHKQHQKWYACISINKTSKFLGLFAQEEDAARAYDIAAIEHFGEFARINFNAA